MSVTYLATQIQHLVGNQSKTSCRSCSRAYDEGSELMHISGGTWSKSRRSGASGAGPRIGGRGRTHSAACLVFRIGSCRSGFLEDREGFVRLIRNITLVGSFHIMRTPLGFKISHACAFQ